MSTRPGTSAEEVRAAVAAALAPERRRLVVTAAARETLQKAEAAYRAATGHDPATTMLVNGQPAASLAGLDPDRGEAAFRFGRAADALAWIHAQIVAHSPRLTGRYAGSHVLLADGRQVDVANPPPAARYMFVNLQPYSKKIERGASRSAPDGVYEGVAAMADRQFGNSVRVAFGYESPLLGYIPGARNRAERNALRGQPLRIAGMRLERSTRVPAITVTVR